MGISGVENHTRLEVFRMCFFKDGTHPALPLPIIALQQITTLLN